LCQIYHIPEKKQAPFLKSSAKWSIETTLPKILSRLFARLLPLRHRLTHFRITPNFLFFCIRLLTFFTEWVII